MLLLLSNLKLAFAANFHLLRSSYFRHPLGSGIVAKLKLDSICNHFVTSLFKSTACDNYSHDGGFILPLIHYKDEKDGEELVVYFGNVDRLSSFLVEGLCLSDEDTLKIGGGYFSLPFNVHRTRFGLLGKYVRLDHESCVTQSLSTFMLLQGDGSKIEKGYDKSTLRCQINVPPVYYFSVFFPTPPPRPYLDPPPPVY